MNGLRGAIQFLTRVPIRTSHAVPHERIVPWFGIVGALIGAVVGGVAVGLGELVPTGVAAGCAVIVGLLVTGAFHEDGLADIADAFGGGHDVERRLEILKDPRHGTYGVAALASSVVLRVVAAASIASASAVLVAFVAAHSIGRLAAVAAMKVAPPAVESGLGASAGRSLRAVPTSIGAGAALAIVAALAGWWVGPFLIAGVVAVVAVVTLAMRKIGGIAGDVLGAVEQVAECLVLIVASGLAARHTVWWA